MGDSCEDFQLVPPESARHMSFSVHFQTNEACGRFVWLWQIYKDGHHLASGQRERLDDAMAAAAEAVRFLRARGWRAYSFAEHITNVIAANERAEATA